MQTSVLWLNLSINIEVGPPAQVMECCGTPFSVIDQRSNRARFVYNICQ